MIYILITFIRGLFPDKLAEKDDHYGIVVPYLADAANRTRLVLDLVTEVDDVVALWGSWTAVYPISVNKAISTKTHRETRDQLVVDIEDKLRFIFDEIPSSVLTLADRNTLNLKLRDTTPSSRPQIDSIPFAKLINIGGGRIREIVRTNSDDSRASIHPDANGVETVYVITAADAVPPASPAACPNKVIITKPRFEIECGIENLGKRVYGFSRWINLNDTSKSGPYSDFFTTVLGGSGDE